MDQSNSSGREVTLPTALSNSTSNGKFIGSRLCGADLMRFETMQVVFFTCRFLVLLVDPAEPQVLFPLFLSDFTILSELK